jgi:5-(carboxyamino)imidazole ribonucleotide synthase
MIRMKVGIIGAGQLGRMLALAGYPLGIEPLFLDKDASTPGGQVGDILSGEFTDQKLLQQLARSSDVLTFDWENISVDALQAAAGKTPVAPPLRALAASQDRLAEKRLFEKLAIPTTRYVAVTTRSSLSRAMQRIGVPGVLKTRRFGYDGKGQAVLRSEEDADRVWALFDGRPLIYEEFVPFDFEVSIIGARSATGEIAIYPLNCNLHREGILRLTRAPWGPASLHRQAAAHLRRMLEHFRYVGVLNIEFFVRRGRLITNETAPRVHNSGHWTIEGAVTSQFENHLRAILGWPLGSTAARGHSAMINLIGHMPERDELLAQADLHWHDYGKEPRPARKLGHLTLVANSAAARDRLARRILKRVDPDTAWPRI